MPDNIIEVIVKMSAKGFDKVKKDLNSLSNDMSKIGKTMTLGLTLPLAAAGTAAVKLASDLQESMSKTEVVFQESADTMKKWASDAATNMGLSTQKALEAAGTFGNLFRTIGLTSDQSAEMSSSLVQLASDLASFNNLNTDDVLIKIQSGLAGQSMAVRTLGIDMNAARMEAVALSMGLIEEGEALSANARVLAAYQIMMEDTTLAQGDFGNTSQYMANSLRIMQAELENAGAELGMVLLPYVLKAVKWFTKLIKAFSDLPQGVQSAIVGFGVFIAALGPLLSIMSKVISVASGLSGALGAGGALSGAFTALSGVVTGTIVPALSALLAPLAALLAPIAALAIAIGALVVTIKIFGADAWESAKRIGALGAELVKIVAQKSGAYWAEQLKKAGEAVKDFIKNLVDMVKSFWETIKAGADFAKEFIQGIIEGLEDGWKELKKYLKDFAGNVIDTLKSEFLIGSPSRKLAYEIGEPMADGIGDGFGRRMSPVARKMAQNTYDSVIRMEESAKRAASEVGSGIAEGIGEGWNNTAGGVFSGIFDDMNNLIQDMQDMFDIFSPSGVMAKEIGVPLAQGIQEGFSSQMATGGAMMGRQTMGAFGGGARRMDVNVSRVEYHGSFSDNEKRELNRRQKQLAMTTITDALERAAGV